MAKKPKESVEVVAVEEAVHETTPTLPIATKEDIAFQLLKRGSSWVLVECDLRTGSRVILCEDIAAIAQSKMLIEIYRKNGLMG